MKEQLEKEKSELEQRVRENEAKIEEIQNSIYFDRKRIQITTRQLEQMSGKSEKPTDNV